VTFFTDGYTDRRGNERAELVEHIRQLKCASWAEPGDRELREAVEQVELELRAFDAVGRPNGSAP
jgi:hypothetical protein